MSLPILLPDSDDESERDDQLGFAFSDSGASTHCFTSADREFLVNIRPVKTPHFVHCASGQRMEALAEGDLPFSWLNADAKRATIYRGLKQSLISTGQLCQEDMIATYTKNHVTISNKNNNVFWKGDYCRDRKQYILDIQNGNDGARAIQVNMVESIRSHMLVQLEEPEIEPLLPRPLAETDAPMAVSTDPTAGTAANQYPAPHSIAAFVDFMSRALCGIPLRSLELALMNGLIRIPGFTVKAVRRWLQQSSATDQGHMALKRANIQRRKDHRNRRRANSISVKAVEHVLEVDVALVDHSIHADLTGPMAPSLHGLVYHMVSRCPLTGYIHIELLTDRHGPT